MKNIYIIGIPRSGKSTLSRKIKSKYPEMNIISFEAIRNGFIKTREFGTFESLKSRKSFILGTILSNFLIKMLRTFFVLPIIVFRRILTLQEICTIINM